MSDRRRSERDAKDRRTFPRPPLWLNLTLLALAVAFIVYGHQRRISINERYADFFKKSADAPAEMNRIRTELASLDLSEQKLRGELDSRMTVVESLKSKDFYLSLDSSAQKLRFYYGNDVLREADMTIGAPQTVAGGSKTWTFVPLKGAFTVVGKAVEFEWSVPEWVYRISGQPFPQQKQTIRSGLGKYVIFLPNDYVIHSPPPAESPLKGPKPGSFMVPEGDLQAIWPRITSGTRVFVF